MRHILIAAHGNLASALQKSVEMIYGETENVTCMDFYNGDEEAADYERRIDEYFSALGEGDEVIVCTDLLAGSVSQKFLAYCPRPGAYLISGVNLSAVLEAVMCDGPFTREVIEEIVRVGREQLSFLPTEGLSPKQDEDFFEE